MIYVITTGWGMDYRIAGLVEVPEGTEIPNSLSMEVTRLLMNFPKTVADTHHEHLIRLWIDHGGDPLIPTNHINHRAVACQIIAHRSGGKVHQIWGEINLLE